MADRPSAGGCAARCSLTRMKGTGKKSDIVIDEKIRRTKTTAKAQAGGVGWKEDEERDREREEESRVRGRGELKELPLPPPPPLTPIILILPVALPSPPPPPLLPPRLYSYPKGIKNSAKKHAAWRPCMKTNSFLYPTRWLLSRLENRADDRQIHTEKTINAIAPTRMPRVYRSLFVAASYEGELLLTSVTKGGCAW